MKHCPNCVTPLQENRKKLGKYTRWLICPNCGFRTRPDVNIEAPNIIKNVNTNKRIIEDEANNRYNL